MADRNEPVGARLGRGLRSVGDFFGATGERPAAGGAYAMTAEEEREEAAQAMRDLQARRAARAAERAAAPSAITNRPVGGNLAAAQRSRPAPAGAVFPGEEQPLAERPAERSAGAAQRAAQARQARRSGGRGGDSGAANRLNAVSLALARGERPRGAEATNIARRMGIEGYKKGGVIGAKKPVKKAAGGSIKAAAGPKVPGRAPGRPATAVKPMGTKPMAKAMKGRKPTPMPAFKKGGKVAAKKGRGR